MFIIATKEAIVREGAYPQKIFKVFPEKCITHIV